MADVKPIPEGYHSVTPYLVINGAAEALEYLQEGVWRDRTVSHGARRRKIGHAEMKIGDSPIMLSDEHPEKGTCVTKDAGWQPGRAS